MCAAALRQVGIGKIVYGCGNERFGGNGSVLGLHDDDAIVSSPGYESVGGYLRDEAIMMLRRFYVTENTNAPKPQNKSRRVLKTEIQPPGVSMQLCRCDRSDKTVSLHASTTATPSLSISHRDQERDLVPFSW